MIPLEGQPEQLQVSGFERALLHGLKHAERRGRTRHVHFRPHQAAKALEPMPPIEPETQPEEQS